MKWFIASDIHGSAYYSRLMLDAFAAEHADRLLLLGDILYHGPRNDLPRDYAPKAVIAMLSEIRHSVLCVRGNCDTEVDQMVLPFPILAEYAVLALGNQLIYATHGHIRNAGSPPPMQPGDILLHGHTHVPTCRSFGTNGEFLLWNPGSVSLPKEQTPHSYMLLDDTLRPVWKDLETSESFAPNHD